MPVLPLDSHLPTQYTTHTITLQQWTNNKTNKSYKQLTYIYISHVNVTQTVPDISPLMPMYQDPLLVVSCWHNCTHGYGPLASYLKLRVAHALGMPGTCPPSPRVNDPDMHYGTCVTHVPWCIPGSLTSGFLLSRLRGKRSRHSRRMRNPKFTYLVRGPWPSECPACLRDWLEVEGFDVCSSYIVS